MIKNQNYILHRPWADILFETNLPSDILKKMLKISDDVLTDSKRMNWGNNLAGQIKDELLISPGILEQEGLLSFFGNMIREYVYQYEVHKPRIKVDISSMWIVEQQIGEYNPIHTHTNCDISAVMYLKIPEYLSSNKPERDDDGAILFIGGAGMPDKLKTNAVKINPKPGQFFIFPGHMMHTVYPYRTNDDFARRSISFNSSFTY